MRSTHGALNRELRTVVVAVALLLAAGVQLSAAPRAGRLSKDLRDGYDAGRASFDVIVSASGTAIRDAVARYGVKVKKQLKNGAVLEASREALEAMSQDASLGHLSGDTLVRSMMAVSNEAIGADQAWAGMFAGVGAVTGRGVGVAVIDSGVSSHAALRGRVVAALDFTSSSGKGEDAWGHGTHVAGIIAGSSESFKGVAPGAHLVSLKVLDENGAGRTSDAIAAIDWVVANRARYDIRVINLSLGRPVFDSYVDDPLCQAVERAYRAGLVVIASAGNYGQLEDGRLVAGGIVSPGNSPYALTIGAIDTKGTAYRSDDRVAAWSSKGPTLYDELLKPDLVAPGRSIVSLSAPGSYLARNYPERLTGSGSSALFRLSGTSMAAAVASGAAAVVLEANKGLTPAQVRIALQLTSTFLPAEGIVGGGAGSLNVAAAVQVGAFGPDPSAAVSVIAGETAELSGLVFGYKVLDTIVWGSGLNTIVWGSARDTIVWGSGLDTIVWGSARDTIVWGSARDTIVWGSARDTIVWGSRLDTIVWGSARDTIVWGSGVDTIVWGSALDTIVWGSARDTIVWGS